jgi:Ycf66 protein N-terminus
MLAYILAVFVGTGSVGLYISAFFFPEIHRKQDFIWSGVGFFYALVLWIYARQETGGILLGQTTSVALLSWLAWQTLTLRRQLVPVNQQTPIPSPTKLKEKLGVKPSAPKTAKTTTSVATVTPVQPDPLPRRATTQPSVSQELTSIEDNMPKPVQQIFQPPNPTPVVEEEAWIKLEVKPASAPTKPLGTAVQPPANIPTASVPDQAPAVVPEVIAENSPTELAQAKAELDLENENWA